jgi:hypothetical protein
MSEDAEQDTTVSLTAVVAELREIDQRKAELEIQAAEMKKAALDGIVEAIRKYITDLGYTVPEIAHLLVPGQKAPKAKGAGKTRKASGTPAAKTVYYLRSDPTKTYSKGPLPTWMKDAMLAAGKDPSMGLDRTEFKASHMAVVTGAETSQPELLVETASAE